MSTSKLFIEGEIVLVQAKVLATYSHCVQVGFQSGEANGKLQLISVPYDLLCARDAADAMEAARAMLLKTEQLVDVSLRLVAEVHALGGQSLPPEAFRWLRPEFSQARQPLQPRSLTSK